MNAEYGVEALEALRVAKQALKDRDLTTANKYQGEAIDLVGETPEVWRVGKAILALETLPESGWPKVEPYIVDLMPES